MRLTFSLMLLSFVAAGCASRGNVDRLEAQVREQEDQLRALHAQVDRTNSELTAARRLNDSLKQKIVRTVSHDELIDLGEQVFRVAGLKINTLLTGGFDRDGRKGDDQVTVFFAPIDDRGQPVQFLGRVECELFDASQQRLGLWTFDPDKVKDAWQKTLGNSGYRFELPWQSPPESRDLELRVRLHPQHGDRFEASTPIRITLPKPALGADQKMP